MPQDIPVEASETLAFTPAVLKDTDSPPVFTLRSPTTRDKRYLRRLQREEGLIRHDDAAMRAETLNGLKELWSAEDYEKHVPLIEEYWQARDDFALQRKDDPDLVFAFRDPELEKALTELLQEVLKAHRPLRVMVADNADFNEQSGPLMVAIVAKGWTGLNVKPVRERGYISLESAATLEDALEEAEKAAGLEPGFAFTELIVACVRRLYLDEEEAKNSASPSPSTTNPPNSNTASARGKSKASANSKKTPEKA